MEEIIRCVEMAGKRTLELRGCKAETKEDGTPVTRADLESDRILRSCLEEMGFDVYSEESPREVGSEFILLDPLDGTKEFLKGGNDFSICLALIRRGRVKMSVVHFPALGRTYWFDGKHSYLSGKRIKVSKALRTMAASRSHFREEDRMLAEILGLRIARAGGSMKGCMVAEGSADIYPRFYPMKPWDVAPQVGIVIGAGGRATDINGNPLDFGTSSAPPFLMSNGKFHGHVLSAMRRVVHEVQGNP